MPYYVPSTESEQKAMLDEIGVSGFRDLYGDIPESLMIGRPGIAQGMSELGVRRKMEALASENKVFRSIFRGAGAYNHYIPSLVKQITSREEFVTGYTPYQAEISQGTLQAIFEFQTMMCELTGLAAANASVYDGATAAAEAAAMCREKRRARVLVSETASPNVTAVMRTYAFASGTGFATVPAKNGVTDAESLRAMMDDTVSCVYIASPNYFGIIEDAGAIGKIAHAGGAKFVMGVNPIAAAILSTPAECGADVAVGEGQPLGMPLSFGGPYLGFMTASAEMTRRLPGRIVGETTDSEGNRAFVLTMQAREQHIRREKASSNVCSNQALCALTASVYLTVMGPGGLREAASQCYAKAHYAASAISAVPGFEMAHEGEFFHEFVTKCPAEHERVLEELERRGILGGLPVNDGLLWCVTEMNTKDEIDGLASVLKGVARR
ncbi:MAG: aminomethyl-transferring glycine dehydrogenase subunit GcvPA [Synergistaceae bacterium]|jgi:glycine dehydrogenase subunit 1|nr:aminomethyl-transferring glycine dehydrogenase subunit GcvPA [Synergistaceae bacterium]